MPWTNNGEKGEGLVVDDATLAAGVPVTGDAQDVAVLDFVSFSFKLTQVAATVVLWYYEGSTDGTNYKRMPVNEDTSSPPDVTLDNGVYKWTRAAGKDDWVHPNVRVTGLKKIRVVADSTGGTTDKLSVHSHGEALSAR
jgi:hypothetical protein